MVDGCWPPGRPDRFSYIILHIVTSQVSVISCFVVAPILVLVVGLIIGPNLEALFDEAAIAAVLQ